MILCRMSSNSAPVSRNMLLCANPDLSERNFAFVYLTALRTVPEVPKSHVFESVLGGFIDAIGDFMSHAEDQKVMF